jgi:ACT domain-containing protein
MESLPSLLSHFSLHLLSNNVIIHQKEKDKRKKKTIHTWLKRRKKKKKYKYEKEMEEEGEKKKEEEDPSELIEYSTPFSLYSKSPVIERSSISFFI